MPTQPNSPSKNAEKYLSPGVGVSTVSDLSAIGGSAAQQAFGAEYNLTTLDKVSAVGNGNSAGITDPVGTSTASTSSATAAATAGASTPTSQSPIGPDGTVSQGMTGYNQGTGWWLGIDHGTPKLSIGIAGGSSYMTWDGSALNINGVFNLGGSSITINSTQDIQTYINIIVAAGGGTLYLLPGTWTLSADITLSSKVKLVGAGLTSTFLNFNNTAFGIKATGTSATPVVTVGISNLAVINSHASAAIDLTYTNYAVITSVQTVSCTGIGIRFSFCYSVDLADSFVFFSGSHGLVIHNDSTISTNGQYGLQNVFVGGNGGDGFQIQYDSGLSQVPSYFINCISSADAGIAFNIEDSSEGFFGMFMNCYADLPSSHGYYIGSSYNNFLNCIAVVSTGSSDGFTIKASNNSLTGCLSEALSTGAAYRVATTVSSVTMFGNQVFNATTPYTKMVITDANVFAIGTVGTSSRNDRKVYTMKNTSGGSLTIGSVVTFKAVANGDEITTTTNQGDNHVFGMIQDATIANAAYGTILTEGYTASLKVNGTSAIAIGDFLGTYTTAGIAMKAASGDTVFAIALAAYATADSLGVINALLVTPRKI